MVDEVMSGSSDYDKGFQADSEAKGAPLGVEPVTDEVLAAEMAAVEEAARVWASRVADELKNPGAKNGQEFTNPWHNDVLALAEAGVSPEDIVAYGEMGAEDIKAMSEFATSLEGKSKAQLVQEYVKLLAEVFINNKKRYQEYDESKKLYTTVAPQGLTQSPVYTEASRAYDLGLQKKALVLGLIKGENLSKKPGD